MTAMDVEVQRDKPSNDCCAALQEQHSKLLEKYAKVEEVKNRFRQCTKLVQNKYDLIEKDYQSLKKAFEELEVQANILKDEKDKEAGRRSDLEDEVSALQDEVPLLKQDEKLQERIAQAEEEIKRLKELLEQERGKATSEKKNAEMEKKKADDALKKLEKERNKISEAQKAASSEKKKTEGNRLLLEKLKKETEDLKSALAFEKCKYKDAEKKVEAEKQNTIRERKRAEEHQKLSETSLKKANLEKDRADDLNRKLEQTRNKVEQLEGELLKYKSLTRSEDGLLLEKSKKEFNDLKSVLALEKSKFEAAHKKLEVERQKAIGERKRADMADVKSKEQKELAEMNLKKAKLEKDRADDLNRKLEEANNNAEKLELELCKHVSSAKSIEVLADKSNTGRNAVSATDTYMAMLKNDTPLAQWVEKMLLEKEQDNIKEKRRAASEKKKAKKQREAAEEYKKRAMKEKNSADQLSGELQKYKLRVEELQKELEESISCRIYANNSRTMNNDAIFGTDTVKLLKKQLKLEKLLAKHAKEATKIEAFRNRILQQELCHLKKKFLQFQEHLTMLDKSFLLGSEGIYQLEKIGGQSSKSEILGSDGHHKKLLSGIDSRMDPPYRGSNQKMLQSSAINSSSASFSDRPLVGSQERGTLSIMTSANLGEDASNFKMKMSDKIRVRYNKNNEAEDDNRTSSPIKRSSKKRRLGSCEKKRNLGAVNSIENSYAQDANMHQEVPRRLSLLHDIPKGQMDEPEEESLKENSTRKHFRPLKKRKTSTEGTTIIRHLQNSGELHGMPDSGINNSDAFMPASSPGSDAKRSDLGFKNETNKISCQNPGIPQDFDHLVTVDYMKLLDIDNAADEDSYRRAIACPLSPLLPEVEFHEGESLEVGRAEILVNKSSQGGLSNAGDHPARDHPFTLAIENEGTIESCQNWISCSHSGIQKCFIVASDNNDNSSILRILQTICSCTSQCRCNQSVEIFVQNIMHTLSKAEDLSTREKACVLLSLILHEISELGLKNLKNGLGDNLIHSLGLESMKFTSGLYDPALKRMFIESCVLLELFQLIEYFLQQRKVFVYGSCVSAESESRFTSKLNLTLNRSPIVLLEVDASAYMVVTGATLLASLCSAVDHVGFVCEMSCNIIRMEKLDTPVLLAILHAFAHICGSQYFTIQQYSIAMTVVKSLVTFLEKQTASSNSTSFSSSDIGNPSSILPCTDCPFSSGAVPMEEVALMLLENLQKQCHSGSQLQDSLAMVNLLVPTQQTHKQGIEEVSGSGEAARLSSESDENLCNSLDILSLVEVLASVMGWNWTSDHLVGGACEYLEQNLTKGISAADIILLGQVGRLGVGAIGYEDSGVQKIRGCLSEIACGSIFKKLSLTTQFAFITSLFDVSPIKFEEITEGKIETPAAMSESIPSNVREWFCSLNQEQQSFLRLYLAAKEAN